MDIGPYRIIRQLGQGGQGVVHLGENDRGELAAVKVMNGGIDRSFARELAAARQVDEFCTARVLLADLDHDPPYVASEFIDGPALSAVGPVRGAALTRLAIGTATALAAIHRAGVVHRDFKPANVLMGPDGPRVIDFGISRLIDVTATKEGGAGTPPFMAPEQFDGSPVGPAADVFAWGSTMVYAATGRPPFGKDTFAAVAYRILHAEPDLGDLPEPLRAVVARCLAKDPAHRLTARDLLLQLLGEEAPVREDAALRHGATVAHGAGDAAPASGPSPDHGTAPTSPGQGGGAVQGQPAAGRTTGGLSRRALLAGGGAVAAAVATTGMLLWRSMPGTGTPSTGTPSTGAAVKTTSPSPPTVGELATAIESAVGATPMADFSYKGGLSQGDWTFSAKGRLVYAHGAGSSPFDTRMDMTVESNDIRPQKVLLGLRDHVNGKLVEDPDTVPILEYANYAHAMAAIGIIADLTRMTKQISPSGRSYSGALATTSGPAPLWEVFLKMPTVADTKEKLAKTNLSWQLRLDERNRPTFFEIAWHLLLEDGVRLSSTFTTKYAEWRAGEIREPGQ